MQISTEECGFVRVFCCGFLLTRTCVLWHTFEMKNARFESSSDVVRWMESEAAGLWPAMLGSLSFRRSRCMQANCAACLSGEQHQSHVLYGRHDGRRFAVYVPEDLAGEVRRAVENGRVLQDLLVQG